MTPDLTEALNSAHFTTTHAVLFCTDKHSLETLNMFIPLVDIPPEDPDTPPDVE